MIALIILAVVGVISLSAAVITAISFIYQGFKERRKK